MAQIELEPVEQIRVTILMDNVTDVLIADQGAVTRFNAPKSLARSAPASRRGLPRKVSPTD
jgi:hypothetical protein